MCSDYQVFLLNATGIFFPTLLIHKRKKKEKNPLTLIRYASWGFLFVFFNSVNTSYDILSMAGGKFASAGFPVSSTFQEVLSTFSGLQTFSLQSC